VFSFQIEHWASKQQFVYSMGRVQKFKRKFSGNYKSLDMKKK